MSTRIMAVTNQKGGVAKTTTTVNVAACAAELGHKVLVVDLDPQDANATRWLTAEAPARTVWDIFTEESSVTEAAAPSLVEGVDVLGAGSSLASLERMAGSHPGMDMVLAAALRDVDAYDLILMDCPADLGLLTVSALVTAHEVVIPVTPDGLAMAGVLQLRHSIERVTKLLNPALVIAAVVPCRVDKREVLVREALAELVEEFGDKVTPTVRRSTRATGAFRHKQAFTTYAPLEGVTQDYRAVTAALLTEGEK